MSGALLQGGGDPPADVAAAGRRFGEQDVARLEALDGCEHGARHGLGRVAVRQGNGQQPVDAGGREVFDAAGGNECHDGSLGMFGQQPGRAQQIAVVARQSSVLEIGDGEDQAGGTVHHDARQGPGLRPFGLCPLGLSRKALGPALCSGIAPDSAARRARLGRSGQAGARRAGRDEFFPFARWRPAAGAARCEAGS